MARKHHKPEAIIAKLRHVEVMVGQHADGDVEFGQGEEPLVPRICSTRARDDLPA